MNRQIYIKIIMHTPIIFRFHSISCQEFRLQSDIIFCSQDISTSLTLCGSQLSHIYVQNYAMKLFQVLFILEILGSQVFGEICLTHICDSFVQCEPIKLLNQLFDGLSVKVRASVNTFLDLDNEREIVLLAFCYIAYQEIMRKQSHRNVDIISFIIDETISSFISPFDDKEQFQAFYCF